MKSIPFGPSGGLIARAQKQQDQICLRLLFLLATTVPLTVRLCFAGRGRNPLCDSDGHPEPGQECRLRAASHKIEVLRRWREFRCLPQDSLQLWESEISIPVEKLLQIRYLTVYVGNPDVHGAETWHLHPETILLEAAKKHWGLRDDGDNAAFVLMTRGDATTRLNRLHAANHILQSNTEAAADALFDIWFLLTGGTDTHFMTCDLED